MKVFLQSVFGQLFLIPYIFWRGYHALPDSFVWRVIYLLLFVSEWVLFLIGFFFHKSLPDGLMIFLLHYCNTWYVASLYIAGFLLVLDLFRLSHRVYPWFPLFVATHGQRIKMCLFMFVAAGIAILMVHGYRTAMYPVVKHLHITLPKNSPGRDSLTIVMMSDLHIGEIIGKKLVQRFVSLSNAQNPDMVVLVGDIMDYESRFAEKDSIENDLKCLTAPLGTFIVYGNHEYRANRFAKKRWLQKTGGTLLVDSAVMPDSAFYLVGRDDWTNKRRAPLRKLMDGLDRSRPVIVLDHQPWSFAEMRMNGVSLGLHGHTHNGQLWPYPLVMKWVYENPYGYSRRGATQHYVSSGIGLAGAPYRIGTVSELAVLHITFR